MKLFDLKYLLISPAIVAMAAAHALAIAGTPAQGPESAPEAGPPNVLRVTAKHPDDPDADDHYIFEFSAGEIESGWVTMDVRNESSSTHIAYVVKVPEEQAELTREAYMDAVSLPFQDAWDPYFAREIDVGAFFDELIPALPGWFFDAVPSGGSGLLSGGERSQSTIFLTPGTYFIECYLLDTEGVFHTTHGMVKKLVVTEADSGAPEPGADLQVSVSTTGGIVFEEDNVQPGLKTFQVTFEDNDVYGHGLGHDVHLIRLDGETTIEEVNVWVNYLDVGADGFYADRGALVSASGHRGPQTFLGGVQDLFPDADAGQEFPLSAYFQAVLRPGHYALVAEVPNPVQPFADNPEVSMLHEFSVTPWAGLTGAWYDPDTDGQGWSFIAAPEGVFGYFYGYGSAGDPLWLITEEVIGEIESAEPVTYNLMRGTGGSFTEPVSPDDLDPWGEVTFTFESCDKAVAEISGLDGTATHQLVRVSETAGLPDCAL